MKRNLLTDLLAWRESPRRKPLILDGARQTGKTWLLKEFARLAYEGIVYLNFDEDKKLRQFFAGDTLKPARIIADLQIYLQRDIRPERDLIVFDEVQECGEAVHALKYFCEEANDYHVAAAGSLLGLHLVSSPSFPVGKVNFLRLHPMTFLEFLEAAGATRLGERLQGATGFEPLPGPFHDELIGHLRHYYFVGGMPEAVVQFVKDQNLAEVRTIHREIIGSYVRDFAKHAPHVDIPRLLHIWEAIPSQLARENKKFVFSQVRPGARARDYESALLWLQNAGLIHRAMAILKPELPLAGRADLQHFKVYLLDIGLLGTLAGLSPTALVNGAELFTGYKGAFVENFVAQELVAAGHSLFFWKREQGIAEVDFLLQVDNQVYPLEVKAGINPKSKSLQSFDATCHPPLLLRATLLNARQDGRMANVPLYAVASFPSRLSAVGTASLPPR
jgi:predicted AAA+ superfamily ATPase